MVTWNKIRLDNYFHNYIRYLIEAGIITEGTARKIEERKKDIISNAFERNPAGRNYPFVIVVAGPRLYCLIDLDTGWDLRKKPQKKAAETIISQKRHRLSHEEVMAVEKVHELELILSEKKERLTTQLSLRILWRSRGSYAEIIELT